MRALLPRFRRGAWSMSDGDGADIHDGGCATVEWLGMIIEVSWGWRGR